MKHIKLALQWATQKLRRLRALVNDEDHDSWNDDHRGGQAKSPNVGGNLGGFGG